MKSKHIVIAQAVFLIGVFAAVYLLYPKIDISVNNNWVSFNSINAKVIMISDNPDFSNPRYLDLEERKDISLNLNPGKYYWKAYNGIVQGLKNEFVISDSRGAETGEEGGLVEISDVKVNVTKEGGQIVGKVVFGPDEDEVKE